MAYLGYAEQHYSKNGKPTDEVAGIKVALRLLRQRYGKVRAVDFGPLSLKALQNQMVEEGQSRGYINQNTGRIKRIFAWAVGQELIPVAVHQALLRVPGLRKGKTKARETKPVPPVGDEAISRTLPFLSPTISAMVRLQRLIGCRPTEICILRPCDVDRSGGPGAVWIYRPESHKTEHHGHQRRIFIGPKAKMILRPYLNRPDDAYCFSPQESEEARAAERREKRETPMTPSQAKRRPKRNGKRRPGERYTNDSYCRAIRRACEAEAESRREAAAKAGATAEELKAIKPEYWRPNQLRHSAATEIREKYGLEAAQVVLGHSKMNTTEIYAEKNAKLAEQVAREVG